MKKFTFIRNWSIGRFQLNMEKEAHHWTSPTNPKSATEPDQSHQEDNYHQKDISSQHHSLKCSHRQKLSPLKKLCKNGKSWDLFLSKRSSATLSHLLTKLELLDKVSKIRILLAKSVKMDKSQVLARK